MTKTTIDPTPLIDPYQEVLDDPSVPFSERWSLLEELDWINGFIGTYRRFLGAWDRLVGDSLTRGSTISVLEVGSGSGGLSKRLQAWGESRGVTVKIHLYDAQEEVLKESRRKFSSNNPPELHLPSPDHLQSFPDECFDYVISLHVLHHIQPFETASAALNEMFRISRRGVCIMDMEQRLFSVTLTRVLNFLLGTSRSLARDGIKSLNRSYGHRQIVEAVNRSSAGKRFRTIVTPLFWMPYWTLGAVRASDSSPQLPRTS